MVSLTVSVEKMKPIVRDVTVLRISMSSLANEELHHHHRLFFRFQCANGLCIPRSYFCGRSFRYDRWTFDELLTFV